MSTKLGLITGLGAGAGLMFLCDPDRGARRRAVTRDKLVHGLHKTSDAAGTTARDLSHRLGGTAARVWHNARKAPVSDEVLVQRVRAKLGRFVAHPHALEVKACDGLVSLIGPILTRERKRLLKAVAAVAGVCSIDDRLEAHASAGDV